MHLIIWRERSRNDNMILSFRRKNALFFLEKKTHYKLLLSVFLQPPLPLTIGLAPPPPPGLIFFYPAKKSPTRTSYYWLTNNCMGFFPLFIAGPDFICQNMIKIFDALAGKTLKLQNLDMYHTPSRLDWLNIAKRWNLFDVLFMQRWYLLHVFTLYYYSLNCQRDATWTFQTCKPETCSILKYPNRTGDPDPTDFVLPFKN